MNTLLNKAIEDQDIKSIKYLLENSIYNDFDFYEEMQDNILSYAILETQSIKIIELLLKYGINTGFEDTHGRTPIGNAIYINRLDICSKLIEYGARGTIDFINPITGFTLLEQAIIHSGIDIIQLLLDNGADTCIQEDIDIVMTESKYYAKDIWTDTVNIHHATYVEKDYPILKQILNPNNPPYLKLGESEQDKYIIYENKEIGEEINIYLLADKQKHKEKKYLYADNKIDAFFYWCYQKGLLEETVINILDNYASLRDVKKYTELASVMKNTIGEQLTTDIFNKEGKTFATSYFTVTHWWYNLHTDFNRLYQEENVKLPRAIKSQEEFDTLMKLLDIRYEQFTSGKDFNANQNKAELEALIEGQEPPRREVDSSFLEDTTPIAQIRESTNQTHAPTTGNYQAHLPEGHPDSDKLKANPFAYNRYNKGEPFSYEGLEAFDSTMIEWRKR